MKANRRFEERARPPAWQGAAKRRRVLLTTLVLTQTAAGVAAMQTVLPYRAGNPVEIAILVLFGILFLWISVGFWVGVTGFVIRRLGGDPHALLNRHGREELERTPLARTAIVMPIYHEEVDRTLAGLRAVYLSLEASGEIGHFDFYILSDSRDPDYWLSETTVWYQLCHELGAFGRLFYRRRPINMNYKSGNVADFLRRWGRRYEYMIVLDADSLMEGRTLVDMVRLMQLEPAVGILQTSPAIVNAQSLFARVQQFSSQLYGPLFTAGLAAYQLGEAAYWGHNAIIRIRPFMDHCGLKKLRGFGVFRGPISSHDFVEAAYMARAGHEVWLEPDIGGSYEESPPSLVDELARDKRWAKGNLQHLWLLLFGRRLRMAHRMAFANGIMSYLASPLWLCFLVLATVATARMVLQPIDYFPVEHSLFPLWPRWRPEWAIGLAGATLVLLFAPKLLAVLDALLTRRAAAHGGFGRLTASVLLETVVSALLAPIRMLAHSRYVIEALFNVTLRWAGQNRSAETGWRAAVIDQAPGSILAASWAGFAWWLDPVFFYWSLPVAVPLLLAAPTSVLFARVAAGSATRRRGLLLVGSERAPVPLLGELADGQTRVSEHGDRSAFVNVIVDPVLNRIHVASTRVGNRGIKREVLVRLARRCLEEGPEGLSGRELSMLAKDAAMLEWLHRCVWQAAPTSYWGRAVADRIDGKDASMPATIAPESLPNTNESIDSTPYRTPPSITLAGEAGSAAPAATSSGR